MNSKQISSAFIISKSSCARQKGVNVRAVLLGTPRSAKTCSQQKVMRIKRFWSKHFRPRNKTIFTEYDRKKSRLSSINTILFLCLKAFTSQACYVNAFLLGTSLANLFAPWGRRMLVHALLPGTRRSIVWQFPFEEFWCGYLEISLGDHKDPKNNLVILGTVFPPSGLGLNLAFVQGFHTFTYQSN